MVYVNITNELKQYEADIRDLCLAFFPMQKIRFAIDLECKSNVIKDENTKTHSLSYEISDDIYINDFFSGKLCENRNINKSEIKRQLYNYLSKKTGKVLLWGTLTGIRPVTIVTKMIDDIDSCEETYKETKGYMKVLGLSSICDIDNKIYRENELLLKRLKDEYYISDEKAYELIKIARNEISILKREKVKDYKKSYSIYIGVPFCKSTCLYCSFTSFNIDKYSDYVDKYLLAFETELRKRFDVVNYNNGYNGFDKDKNQKLDYGKKYKPLTLYVGGGTPTSLDEKSFERFLNIVDKYIDTENCIEYTIEAGRPDTITENKLKLMKEHKVTRISINPQTFNQKTLDLIGRKHTVKEIIEKYRLARKIGFDNINMDIILGLPNEHLFGVIKTILNLYRLKPDSLTIHSLALKRAARLNYELDSWTKKYYLAGMKNYKVEGKREIDVMFKLGKNLSEIMNLKPYYLYRQKNMAGNLENIGFAKVGKECIYNIMMMSERHSVYGFGTATTKEVFYENAGVRIESTEGYKSVIDYCNSILVN